MNPKIQLTAILLLASIVLAASEQPPPRGVGPGLRVVEDEPRIHRVLEETPGAAGSRRVFSSGVTRSAAAPIEFSAEMPDGMHGLEVREIRQIPFSEIPSKPEPKGRIDLGNPALDDVRVAPGISLESRD